MTQKSQGYQRVQTSKGLNYKQEKDYVQLLFWIGGTIYETVSLLMFLLYLNPKFFYSK